MAEPNAKHQRTRPRDSRKPALSTESGRVGQARETSTAEARRIVQEFTVHLDGLGRVHGMVVEKGVRFPSRKKVELNFEDMAGLIRTIDVGLRWSVIEGFLKRSGLNQAELAEFLEVPDRTLARRREKGALTKVESERFARLVEIFNACVELFDRNSEAAREWLTTPAYGLSDVRPIDFAKNEFGAREVRNLIGRLQDGVFS